MKVDSVSFTDAGGIFATGKTYAFTAKGQNVIIFVNKLQTDIIGQPIPHGLVNITGVSSQYSYTSSGGYQLLPRTIADIQKISAICLTSPLNNTKFTKTELDFDWSTNITSTSEMYYGLSAATVKTNLINGIAGTTNHSIARSGIAPGEIT